jgi:hypothetical protein
MRMPSLNYQNPGEHLQDSVLFDPMLQNLMACPVCLHLSTQRLESQVANNQAACAAALAAGGDRTFNGLSAKHGCFCHTIHCCRQPTRGNCPECTSKVQNGQVPEMVGTGQCGFDCAMCRCMCKVCFEEQHWHTITIAIAKERMREGGVAEAPCKEKAVSDLSQFIVDSLNNNLVRDCQHCDGRSKEEVFQDAASRTAHKLYSSSHFASLGSKFSMSLQKDIQQRTNV